MILVVYLDSSGIFHLVAVLFFSKTVFRRVLKLPKLRGSIRKKKVVHLYRSTRLSYGRRHRPWYRAS